MTEEQHAEAILRAAYPFSARCATSWADLALVLHLEAVLTALRAYGDERAAEMKGRAANAVAPAMNAKGPFAFHASDAIRALPLQEPKKAPATVIEPAEPFGRESGLRPGFYEDDMP